MAALTDRGRGDKRFAFSDHLQLRNAIRKREVLSPWVYQASPIHEERTGAYFDKALYVDTHSGEAGKLAVARADEEGFDYFKIYNKLGASAFYTIAQEAKKAGLPVVGHVPHEVSVEEVLDRSLMHSIEHLTGYINPFGAMKFDPERLDEMAARTRESGIWNVPTLQVWKHVVRPERINEIESDRWIRFIPEANRTIWKRSITSFSTLIRKQAKGYEILPSEHIEDFELIVKALIKAKAPLAAGTDSGTLNVVAGSSLHKELAAYVELGMSPWQALAAATSEAARCLQKEDEFGSIRPGLRADLLIVGSNPLADIAHLGDIEFVVVQGAVYTQSELVDMLDSLVSESNL
jgi:imidazolonepropionase-like amidohydrolase